MHLNDYINYLQECELLTYKEASLIEKVYQGRETGGKHIEFESAWKKYLKYGIAAFISTPLAFMPVFYVWVYRKATDTCRKKCMMDQQCYHKYIYQ